MRKDQFPYSKLETPNGEILKQEIVSYVKRAGSILKITVKRNFYEDDYTDSMTTEVICSEKEL